MGTMTTEGREGFGDVVDYPLFLGITIFATSAVYVVMPLENAMKTPRAFTKPFGVMNIAFSIALAVYAGIGICGYLKYGPCTESSVTLNLPTGSE